LLNRALNDGGWVTHLSPGVMSQLEIRHASDYDDFYIASREESERQIAAADEFIQLAEKYCIMQFETPDTD
jgi:hypothetical protein